MGRAFKRLVRQVEGRNPLRERYVTTAQRVGELEVLCLELAAYLTVCIANDPAAPADAALNEAYQHFKEVLGRVTAQGGLSNGSST